MSCRVCVFLGLLAVCVCGAPRVARAQEGGGQAGDRQLAAMAEGVCPTALHGKLERWLARQGAVVPTPQDDARPTPPGCSDRLRLIGEARDHADAVAQLLSDIDATDPQDADGQTSSADLQKKARLVKAKAAAAHAHIRAIDKITRRLQPKGKHDPCAPAATAPTPASERAPAHAR